MNICILSSTALPFIGGLEVVISNLSTALTNLGNKVYHLTPYPKKKIALNDDFEYKVIRFGFKGDGRLKLKNIIALIALNYVVKHYKIDLINVHNVYVPGSWAYNFKKINKSIPIIGTPHGDDVQITPEINDGVRLNPVADRIVRRNLNAFDRITAISESINCDLNSIVNDKNKIVNIPNGVWTKNYQENINRNEIRKKFKISEESIVIISIGRNHPRKGFENGIEAVSMLKKDGLKIIYLLVGREMEALFCKANSYNIKDSLITPGQIDPVSVSKLLQASDIYLSTSIVESFGMTTLEAMSAGLPCVVTNIPGTRDIVSKSFGCFVKPNNSEEIYRSLKYLIENEKERFVMGKKARMASLQYDWINIANQYIEVYKEAINTKS